MMYKRCSICNRLLLRRQSKFCSSDCQRTYVECRASAVSTALKLPFKTSLIDPIGRTAKRIEATHLSVNNPVIVNDDCLRGLKDIPDGDIHMVITDPPYFIDGMDDKWNHSSLKKKETNAKVIGSLPVGMKFDPEQGKRFQDLMGKVGQELFRVLKPGGFVLAFSQARLYHRLGIAFEDIGFEIRDMLGWTYEGQAKAFSQNHFIKKMPDLSSDDKQELIERLAGRKTPQLKPMIEPIVLAQKPKDGTFVENWITHGVGLIDTSVQWNGKFPGQLIDCSKPSKQEKGDFNVHFTVKPVKVIEHLIRIFSKEGDIILDPFIGSGTTALACKNSSRKCVGFEINKVYVDICMERLKGHYREDSYSKWTATEQD